MSEMMRDASDVAATLWWPLVAVTLVLLGMTFASSGRHSGSSTAERRRPAPVGTAGGRRATDRLPGDRTMVVITGDTSADTIRTALGSARRGGIDIVTPVGGRPTDLRG